jgi:hypothetical protein
MSPGRGGVDFLRGAVNIFGGVVNQIARQMCPGACRKSKRLIVANLYKTGIIN